MPSPECRGLETEDDPMTAPRNDGSTSDHTEITRLVSTAIETGQPDVSAPRKRARSRFLVGMQLDVTTDPISVDETWPVCMHNISDGGFAFWTKQQVRAGSRIWVREFSGEEPNPWIAAHVTHCTTGLRGYLVGAEFEPDDWRTDDPRA